MGKLARKKAFASIIRIHPYEGMWFAREAYRDKTVYYVENLMHLKGLSSDICLHFVLHHTVAVLKCLAQNDPDYLLPFATTLEEVFSTEVAPTTNLFSKSPINESAALAPGVPGEWMRGMESILRIDLLRPTDAQFQMKIRGIPEIYEIGDSVFALSQSILHLIDEIECRLLSGAIRTITANTLVVKDAALDEIIGIPYWALNKARSEL